MGLVRFAVTPVIASILLALVQSHPGEIVNIKQSVNIRLARLVVYMFTDSTSRSQLDSNTNYYNLISLKVMKR